MAAASSCRQRVSADTRDQSQLEAILVHAKRFVDLVLAG
ncbi:hypothetical protein SynNOUM97013_00213 [Synechococcus sp. NOUM97013]|nr:hypothetical protein SynNOUM97013_00213 [Synechococcus sp. NOUM97013]